MNETIPTVEAGHLDLRIWTPIGYGTTQTDVEKAIARWTSRRVNDHEIIAEVVFCKDDNDTTILGRITANPSWVARMKA